MAGNYPLTCVTIFDSSITRRGELFAASHLRIDCGSKRRDLRLSDCFRRMLRLLTGRISRQRAQIWSRGSSGLWRLQVVGSFSRRTSVRRLPSIVALATGMVSVAKPESGAGSRTTTVVAFVAAMEVGRDGSSAPRNERATSAARTGVPSLKRTNGRSR